ncbi:FK506-binding protein 8 [Paragonimus westermani]|uniref:peptidylprolyl isomerase n=1 Tax=Paragonimus westermani TaxID=34504 RepID=A0A5J4NKA9_9TREM|nr:FK506-binding protein 8 [Paragonimus westermani]
MGKGRRRHNRSENSYSEKATHTNSGTAVSGDKPLDAHVDFSSEKSLTAEDPTDCNASVPTTYHSSGDDSDDTVDILGNGLLLKKVIDKGLGRETRPCHGDFVEVSLKGFLEDGTVVDDFSSLTLTLGDGDVIQALDLALPLAELKERFELHVNPRFAYGSRGRDPDIPADAKLRYEVQLLSSCDPPCYATMSNEERVRIADQKRERGNCYYRREEYAFAVNSYNKALKILTAPRDPNQRTHAAGSPVDVAVSDEVVENLEIKLENNLAATQLKIEAYDAAIKSCDAVLHKDPRNFKALFRKGKALLEQGDVEEAIPILKSVHDLVPSSPMVISELQRARAIQDRERKRWSRAASRMLPPRFSRDYPESANSRFSRLSSLLVGFSKFGCVHIFYRLFCN